MRTSTNAHIQSLFEASNRRRLHFGELIGELAREQVESYDVDYRAGRTTCHLHDDATLDVACERPVHAIADTFDAGALRAAILGAQQGRVMYPEFRQLSQQAGCIGYAVWIAGRHVTYHGRRGETHVERFPD